MSRPSNQLIGLVVIMAAALAVLVLSAKLGNGPNAKTEPPPVSEAAAATPETNHSHVFTKRARRPQEGAATSGQLMGEADAATNTMPAWEDKLDEVLGSNGSDSDKARQMLGMFPTLPASGQEVPAVRRTGRHPHREPKTATFFGRALWFLSQCKWIAVIAYRLRMLRP